jgi:hypothetical protein
VKYASAHRCAGFTLVEVAIASLLLVLLLGSVALFSDRGVDALGSGTVQSDLDARLRRTLARVCDELLSSGLGVITPSAEAPAGADALTYRKSNGPLNGTNSWGESMRFAFAYEPGELDDGLDNDSDGLVDEGLVEWTIGVGGPTEHTVVLCRGVREYGAGEQGNGVDDDGDGLVDEHGLAFERTGATLSVELTLGRSDHEHRIVVRSLETTLQPRN